MRYRNINPVLTTEILNNSGFNFDGYYYVNPNCPVRFNSERDGFKPSFIDPSAPRFDIIIRTYSDLIKIMHNMLQNFIQMRMSTKNFTTDRQAQEYVIISIHEYYAFDKELNFMCQFTSGGFMPIPNNEYTYSLLDGKVNDFEVIWRVDENEEWITTPFQINSQCVSYPYLLQIIAEEKPEIKSSNILPIIKEVIFITQTSRMPFFGVGIPKLIRKDDRNTEETPSSE